MRKEEFIGFRTNKIIKEAIEKLAKIERRSISSAIETILYHYLKNRKAI